MGDPTTQHLRELLGAIAARIRDRPWRTGEPVDPLPVRVDNSRLTDLADGFGLDDVDLGLVAVATAVELDTEFGALFAALDDPRGRRRPSVHHALALAGGSLWNASDRARLAPSGPLRRGGLLDVDEPSTASTASGAAGPFADAVVHVPERVVRHVLGDDELDPALRPFLAVSAPLVDVELASVVGALREGLWSMWLHAPAGGGISTAVTALGVLDAPAVALELRHGAGLADVLVPAVREAGFVGGGIVIAGVDLDRDAAAVADAVADPLRPVILVGDQPWRPGATAEAPVCLTVGDLDGRGRREVWRWALDQVDLGDGDDADAGPVDVDAESLADLRLSPEQIVAATSAASTTAAATGRAVDERLLRQVVLDQGAGALGSFARRIAATATFDDLVLPDELLDELRGIAGRFSTRHVVHQEWGMQRSVGRGRGLTCLFAGSSGTGKTLAAEVVATSLGVDLFVVDLSQVVSKYIGETEKNLDRVFDRVERLNGVLLFDEADALFGKRSEVRDAHDRHANVEVAYLLQRTEQYDGVAVLTTNLRANVDEAFNRRLDVICAFPDPGVVEREALWRLHLPPTLPLADDVDVALLAAELAVSGGVIRNIAVSAAHAAAITGGPVDQVMLVTAAAREYRKLGRLFDPAPFRVAATG